MVASSSPIVPARSSRPWRAAAVIFLARAASAGIAGLDGEGEAGIGFGIFMATMERPSPAEACAACRAKPTSPARVPSITRPQPRANSVSPAKSRLLLRQMQHDMALGMVRAWRSPSPHARQIHSLAVGDANDRCRESGLASPCGPMILAVPFALEGKIALDMVDMMMGGQDMGELPALALELAARWPRLRARRSRRSARLRCHAGARRNYPGGR